MSSSTIYHIDVNSAFLSWQSCYDISIDANAVDLRTIPAAIGGSQEMRHGIVLAKSTSAKAYGIQTGEPLVNAYRKCPSLVVKQPDFSVYVEYSNRFIKLLHEHTPIVEQYSIDEAYCDMTGMELLHGNPVQYANRLRKEIKSHLGFTVNIGVSSNKLLAKMASDFTKPDKVHTLFPSEIEEKLWPLPVESLFYVGKSTAAKLKSLGIKTIGALAHSDYNVIKKTFKKHGEVIWNYANGIAPDTLSDMPAPNKGYGNSLTIHFDVTDADTAKKFLLSLCETVGERIRLDGVYISVVSVTIVDSEFGHRSKQTTLDSTTNVTELIYQTACHLFDAAWNKKPIRQLGVSTSHASEQKYEQYNLFDMDKYEKLSKLNNAIDNIHTKYGKDSIIRACFLDNNMSGKTSLSVEKQRKKIKKQ